MVNHLLDFFYQEPNYQKRTKLKALKLLYTRELNGSVIHLNKKKSNFKEEIQKTQASNPVVFTTYHFNISVFLLRLQEDRYETVFFVCLCNGKWCLGMEVWIHRKPRRCCFETVSGWFTNICRLDSKEHLNSRQYRRLLEVCYKL